MAAEQYDVKVTVGDAEIEVHGAKDGVVEIVRALSEVLAGRSSRPAERTAPATGEAPTRASVDARSFFQEKAPSSQAEAIAVATYYLTELAPAGKRSPTIDKRKVLDVFRQARYPLPQRTDQSLVNTQKAGYLDRVGPGEYTLTPVGFNLVEHSLG
jgi:hypothetical protein